MPNPNTLFDPATLAESFPDAASSGHLDGLDPHRAPYVELAERFRNNQAMLGIAAQAGVSVDTAVQVADLMNTPSNHSLDTLSLASPEGKAFTELVKGVHRTMDHMLHTTGNVFTLPDLNSPEFAATNWQRLHEAGKAYEQLGIPAEVVFSPINRPLDGNHGWKTFFSGLRAWQDTNHPDSTNKLQKQTDGDGLLINDEITAQWNDVTDTSPNAKQWQVSVVPVSDKAPVVNVAHDGTNAQGDVPTDLSNIIAFLPPTPSIDPNQPPKLAGHPKAETLLTIHATRHFEGKDPIDGKIGGSYYWSWAEGVINNGADGLFVYWFPDYGRVVLSLGDVGNRVDRLGARPEVRG